MKHNLQPLKNIHIAYFNNCDNCIKCCDGSKFLFAPLFLSDIKTTAPLFPIVFIKTAKRYRLVYLLSDGLPCPYLKNGRCSIYESRPHACQTYPFTLFQNTLHLDFDCYGVGLQGTVVASDRAYDRRFFHPRFINWQQKQKKTQHFINAQKGYKKLGKIGTITLYEGIGGSLYHQMIHRSLANLTTYAGFTPA